MLLAIPSDDVGRALYLGRPFLSEAPFDVGPGQLHHGAPFVHRFVGLETKIGQAQARFEVEVVNFARLAPAISLQRLLGGQGEIRTGEVRVNI
jgi:hypothetical protein